MDQSAELLGRTAEQNQQSSPLREAGTPTGTPAFFRNGRLVSGA
jgi:hypothetical protein